MNPQQPALPPAPLALRFGAFLLDESQGRLWRAGQEVTLAPRPFALLCCLVRHANQLLSREALLDAVWGHRHVSGGVLKSAVHVLREALGDDGRSTDCRIESVPRRGYRLVARIESGHVDATGATPTAADSGPSMLAPRLIGRASELQRLAELTAEHRVVTVTGPGGVGKTSLVRRWLAQQGGGPSAVGWCDLATITDPDLAAAELARALRLELGSKDPAAALCQALRSMTMRVVLDNAEHMIDAVARLAEAIVHEAPGVRLVVTSQLPLRVAEERVLPVGPLSLPSAGAVLDPAEARAFGAVDLFARRAEAADPRFQWNAESTQHAVDIVRRLDGLPLALEMAAARLPMFGVAGLADALAQRLDVLTLSSRTAPARQQTLRAALEWSHSLLSDMQRRVLRRLSVFVGPFTLESAQDLAADGGSDRWQVLDALGELVDRSMIVADGRPRRFRWLESPRAFAAERLTAAGEADTWRARHAHVVGARFAAVAAAAYDGSSRLDDALAALRPELPDAREAMRWALEHEPATAVALMAPFNFAAQRDGWTERRNLWEATAAHVTPSLPAATRARWSLGACRFWGDQPEAARHGADAAELCRHVGDLAGLHRALWAQVAVSGGTEPAREAQWLAELATLPVEQLPAFSRFQGHYFEGSRQLQLGDASGAIANYRQALAFAVDAGDSVGALDVRIGLAELELAAGDAHAAIALARELVRQLDGTRHRFQLSYTWLTLAAAWLVAGDLAEARIAAAEAWALSDEGTAHFLCDHAAWLAAVEARPGDAARLLGAADSLRATRSRGERGANEARAFERAQRMARGRLGDSAYHRLRDEGRHLPPREVQRIALRATERDSAYIALPGVS